MKRLWVLLATLLVLAGCGGDDAGSDPKTAANGEKVFNDAGCAGCHTLAAAGSSGQVGPNLDQLKPSSDTVKSQVERGGAGMPAFKGKLSDGEIQAVSDYVSKSAGVNGAGGMGSSILFKPDDTKLASCSGAGDESCYEQAFGNLVVKEGAKPALATLLEDMSSDKAVALGCHRIAHRMGSAALIKYNDDVGLAFSKGDATCSSGYYHGILERAFQGVPQDQLGTKAKELCTTPAIEKSDFLRFQCNHGLGHGLMLTTHYEMPVALDTCDVLEQGYDQEACQGGVFMENFSSSYGITSGYLKDDDLLYPCDDVSEERKSACYYIVTSRILPKLNWDWKKTADVCRTAEQAWIYMCFRSYGRDAISTNAYDQDEARRLCHFATDFESDCVMSVAIHIAQEDRGLDGTQKWCQGEPANLRIPCYVGMGTTGQLLYPDPRERERICARFTKVPEERYGCVSAQFPG